MRLNVVDNGNTRLNLNTPNDENVVNLSSEFSLTYGVEDVQINGESIVDDEKIANIIVDNSLSSTSSNPIMNSTVNSALNTKQDTLSNSQLNAVNSGITAEKVSSYDDKVKVMRSANGCLVFYKNTI